MTKKAKEPEEKISPIIVAALIGLVGTIIVALFSSPLLSNDDRGSNAPALVTIPTITIEGPTTAPIEQNTYFTLISQNAVRGEWSIGGFTNEPIVLDPLPPSHEIYVEPTDASRVGSSFTIAVTVYGANGESATATKQFIVVSE